MIDDPRVKKKSRVSQEQIVLQATIRRKFLCRSNGGLCSMKDTYATPDQR